MSNPGPSTRNRSLGRKKIDIKLIPDENARKITYSKRRSGIFKKATEISTMCGADVGIVVFSIGGKVYSFGQPNVETVVNKFMLENPAANAQDSMLEAIRAQRQGAVSQKLKQQCDEMMEQLEVLKKKGKEIQEAIEMSPCQTSEESLSRLSLHELKGMKEKMEKLKENVARRLNHQQELERPRPLGRQAKLANIVENNEGAISPIPADWLKL